MSTAVNFSKFCLRSALLHLLLGIGLGIYMGIKQDFALLPVHVHINLLGWVTLGLVGLLYHLYPVAGESPLAFWQVVLHHLGILQFMGGLAAKQLGIEVPVAIIAMGSILILLSALMITALIFRALNNSTV